MDDRKSDLGFLTSEIGSAWVKPFRGEIYDYAAGVDLQQGYAVKGRFDIETARWLREPMQSIKDPSVRIVSILAAVQTVKTLLAELVVPYWVEHDPGDILFLYETDDKAKQMAEDRLMPLIRSIPAMAKMLQDIDRHDKTKTKIKFAHCNLVVAGMNMSNVQSASYRYVVADELWMSRASGLVRHAKLRTTQYPGTSKIILLGQGGYQDEDADVEHRQTDMRQLNFACPACSRFQPFELSRMRDDSFPEEKLRGTYSGLSWDTNEHTQVDGRWNFPAVRSTAHIRCHHCDHRIEDTPEIRRALMESYRYVATNPSAPFHSVGFQWPALASPRIPFGDLVEEYLRAKVAKDTMAHTLPMQEFYQKRLAIHWADDIATEYRHLAPEEYDPKSEWVDEKFRVLIVDCQRDLVKFFWSTFALSAAGEIRMLGRGTATSFDELAKIQTDAGIKDQRVFLDCGYRMTDVLTECTRHFHVANFKVGSKTVQRKLCWHGLKGSGADVFTHTHPKNPAIKEARIYSPRKLYNVNEGKTSRPNYAPYYEWSNLHCKDLARARREGEPGIPKMLVLPDTLPPEDQWSYFAQMRSERRVEKFHGGKKSGIWEPVKETRPNHEWDITAMLMAVMSIMGLIGAGGAPEDEG